MEEALGNVPKKRNIYINLYISLDNTTYNVATFHKKNTKRVYIYVFCTIKALSKEYKLVRVSYKGLYSPDDALIVRNICGKIIQVSPL